MADTTPAHPRHFPDACSAAAELSRKRRGEVVTVYRARLREAHGVLTPDGYRVVAERPAASKPVHEPGHGTCVYNAVACYLDGSWVSPTAEEVSCR
jgi:hypothetical protein